MSWTAWCRGFKADMFHGRTDLVFSSIVGHTVDRAGVGEACGIPGSVVKWLVG